MGPRRRRSIRGTLRLAVSLVYRSGPRSFSAIVGCSVLTSLAIAGQLLAGRRLLDLLADGDDVDPSRLAPYLVVLGVLLMVAAVSQAVSAELRIPLSEEVHRRAMGDILDVATEVDLEAYEGVEFHDRLQRAQFAAGGESGAVVFGIATIVTTLVVAAGVVLVLLTVAPLLVPLAVLGYLPIAAVNLRNNRERYRLELATTELLRERSYLEYLMTERSEAKEIRAFDAAPVLRRWHAELWDRRLRQLRQLARRRLALTTVGSVVTNAALVLTLSVALVLTARGSISLGDAAVAIVGLQQLSSRLQSAGAAFSRVHEGMTFLGDFEQFRAELPALRERRPSGVPPAQPTTISVEDVTYAYPGATTHAVRGISLTLHKGQSLAIVGANGSGKSTLAKLLCDLLTPAAGRICWDGVDIGTCDPRLVRARIAPVFQDFAQYQLTVRQAVGLGDGERLPDEAGIRRALDEAGLTEVVTAHDRGLDTRLGKAFADGVDLSVGQWQRLAIARALFRDASVVILDEPSASLDPRAEAQLFELLTSLRGDRIVVFVSHRFATVRQADTVVVLDQGEVVEVGSHDELMEAQGLYHDLFTMQAERYGLQR